MTHMPPSAVATLSCLLERFAGVRRRFRPQITGCGQATVWAWVAAHARGQASREPAQPALLMGLSSHCSRERPRGHVHCSASSELSSLHHEGPSALARSQGRCSGGLPRVCRVGRVRTRLPWASSQPRALWGVGPSQVRHVKLDVREVPRAPQLRPNSCSRMPVLVTADEAFVPFRDIWIRRRPQCLTWPRHSKVQRAAQLTALGAQLGEGQVGSGQWGSGACEW